ncbi:MAG: hypothetical protein LH615_04255 [Ferruginibacter sp.]|nr:hypothetical protein [Ferruginibacter sp.]
MKIKDDGICFNIEYLKGGVGFTNMKRRTESISGSFNIQVCLKKWLY